MLIGKVLPIGPHSESR